MGRVAGGSQLGGMCLAHVVEDVAEDDGGALFGEAAGVCRALSTGTARDERRLAREPGGHPWIAR